MLSVSLSIYTPFLGYVVVLFYYMHLEMEYVKGWGCERTLTCYGGVFSGCGVKLRICLDSHHYFKLIGGVRLTEVVVSH